jgi:transposase-like protein
MKKNLYIVVSGENGSTETVAFSYITSVAKHIGKHPNTVRNWVHEGKQRISLPRGKTFLVASWIREKVIVSPKTPHKNDYKKRIAVDRAAS